MSRNTAASYWRWDACASPTLVPAIAGTGAVSPQLCTPVRPACPGPGQNMGARGTHPSPCRDSRDRPSEAIDTDDEEEGYGTEAFRAPPVCYGHARPGRALVSSQSLHHRARYPPGTALWGAALLRSRHRCLAWRDAGMQQRIGPAGSCGRRIRRPSGRHASCTPGKWIPSPEGGRKCP